MTDINCYVVRIGHNTWAKDLWLMERRGVLDREAFLAQLTSTQLAALGAPPDAVYSNAQDPVRQRRAKQASARM
jgi:hypothetical protein